MKDDWVRRQQYETEFLLESTLMIIWAFGERDWLDTFVFHLQYLLTGVFLCVLLRNEEEIMGKQRHKDVSS